ncbi:MAG: HemK2/MTQ2 family protein methyltransferase [Methanomassiliicoccus sp.]|nr:HemK2/MTQ2 family protein methyltransferase [Methanomassiliicoccus sp.]
MRYQKEIDIEECEDVYPPMEDTFLLLGEVEIAPGTRALEMGCGTGLISCHLAAEGAVLTAADVNPRAVECTRANLGRNNLPGEVVESDLFSEVAGTFDLMVFNPPYLSVEEEGLLERAWAGGKEGVDVLVPFLEGARPRLRPGGRIVLLLSSEMERPALDKTLNSFTRRRLGSRRYFYEELWVEELVPL